MAKKKQNVASQVRELIEKPVTDIGYTIWDVVYYKEGAELILEVMIDKNNGVSIDDCSIVTRAIEPLIDELDPVNEAYCLMVSSAGSDRALNNTDHIEFAMNEKLPVIFKLFSAFESKKEFSGTIKCFDTDTVTIIQPENDSEIILPKKLISKMTASFNIES